MNYQIITDEAELKKFIEWLPNLEEHETYYVCLFARSKYTKDISGKNGIPHIKSDKAQLKRFTSDKKSLFNKIRQLECPLGSYTQKGNPVPQEALALYITVNPRSMYRAIYGAIKHLTTCLQNTNKNVNPHQEVMSEIQRSKSRTCYVDFDVDTKELDAFQIRAWIGIKINLNAVTLLETRGGYHLLVNPNKVEDRYKKTWYKYISSLNGMDQTGDCMIPVPGCYQGGFTPRFT